MNNVWKKISSLMVLSATSLAIVSSSAAWASTEEKIKSSIDKVAEKLKKGVEKAGDKMEDIQNYFNDYEWDNHFLYAVSGPTTIKEILLNGHYPAVVVKPGERIEGEMKCILDKHKARDIQYHRILVGFKHIGPQTSIGQGVGYLAEGESVEHFVLIAPQVPGFYQVRIKSVESYSEEEAFKQWLDEKGEEPDARTTIGLVYVKS